MEEICTYSVSDCPVSHPSQLVNPFLGLPLESGKCESCGTAEHGKCEGHFGYIQLPIPVYHPSHVSELKHILSLVCLKCMRMKKGKVKHSLGKETVSSASCLYCRDLPSISIKEVKTTDGALCLELRVPSRTRLRDGFWNFLDKFGFHYGDTFCRLLLPKEALNILKEIPEETKKRLAGKGYFPQNGFILQCLPIPPNCLCVPEISDGKSIMSSDISISMLKRVLNKIELIKRSRSGAPNFESHEVESNDLQSSISQYMLLRGTTKAPQDITRKYAVGTDASQCSAKKWLDKMKQLFISKGSGFSSRSVITGDAYIGINEIGLPSEIAKRITFEERVTLHNMERLQKMVDDRLCVTYKDGSLTYAIAVGSKGHTSLKVGQVINRQIMDGDIVFINRPPSTHKHSLQAFSVYVHDDHTVKINPLICAPLGADFDGDCVHIFYPQSLSAKAEVLELFSVEKQLLSSHNGNLHLLLVHDSLLSLKLMFNKFLLNKATTQQLAMFVSPSLPPPALIKTGKSGPFWTVLQILQGALPALVDSFGERHLIERSEFLKLDFNRDALQSSLTEIITSIFMMEGPKEALNFFNMLQPLLMEMLFLEGYSITLEDFNVPEAAIDGVRKSVQEISYVLHQLRSTSNDLVELQVENHLKSTKIPIVSFILKLSAMGNLIDSKSDSAILKVVQQLGFLGLQLYDRGKFYSRALVDDIFSHFVSKYSTSGDHPSEAYGLVKNSFFHGLNSYEVLVHSISSREVIVRSSRGLTEPGTLFKNLMAILRDVVVCYDGTVRNVCSNSIVQFEYGVDDGGSSSSMSIPGEPVGVLAATAISNPAYKAVLDSSQSTNSSWELMKEILLCKVSYKNDAIDRRVILYLNDCFCGKRFCKENAAFSVQNCLKRVTLKDCATDFLVEYQKQIILRDSSETASGLVGHIHLDKIRIKELNRSTDDILRKCQDVIFSYAKKKGQLSHFFKKIYLSASSECSQQSNDRNSSENLCLQFSYCDAIQPLERTIDVMTSAVCPILLDTIVKGDPRVHLANIVWIGPDATSWVRNSRKTLKGELAVEVLIEKDAARRNGDAWRTALDACLPVMHLIDTRRSIPYGIRQIQELLGISCAFDQSVQRLSTSIKMVAKGVLKEHLILVGNSMTCTGNLIGFNTGGFKAMFRSLKVQVPFTEATLFTPMKCFERAADKCHTDSLASIVSSCSWGKHVALGTGTRFQIMWDKKQMANEQDIGKDVYDFLELVRTASSKRETSSAFLGVDVDDLAEEDGNNEMCLSPELDADFEKPTFDDSDERNFKKNAGLENGEVGNSSWENVSAFEVKSDNWHGWENGKQPDSDNAKSQTTKPDVWSSWDAGKVQQQPVESAAVTKEFDGFHSWDNAEVHKHTRASEHSDDWKNQKSNNAESRRDQGNVDQPERPTIWNKNVTSSPESQPWHNPSNSKSGIWGSQSSKPETNEWGKGQVQDGWGGEKELPTKHGWDTNMTGNMGNKTYAWDAQSTENAHVDRSSDVDRWNKNKVNNHGSQAWGSHGWGSSNDADCRTQKTHSARPGRSDDRKGWNSNGNFTSTTRRLDSFTSEEEMILVDVQPTIDSIKRILRDSSDGARLSADDDKFIIENVFQYHPDKHAKVAGEVDYIMVDKHQNFQDSRCFYVVSSDGSRADFSYIKCMENFVRHNFPEHADSFSRKYFRKRRAEPSRDYGQQL